MALGGGIFLTQNKVLPGAYINFVSADRASASVSDRGIVTLPLELDWGPGGEVFEVTVEDFQKESLKIFGYEYTAGELKNIREVFYHARLGYFYRINGEGKKASNTYGTAKHKGIRGNDLKTVIAASVDTEGAYEVTTYLGTAKVDVQTVTDAGSLADTDYVTWKKDAVLEETAGMPFTGGENGTVTGTEHQTYLDRIEPYSFHTIGCPATDEATKGLYIAFTKRMRDSAGVKFQLVLQGKAADYEGVINIKNTVKDEGAPPSALVYWVAGASAGCKVNASNTNAVYDGEYTVDTNFKQPQLEKAMQSGEFVFHRVGSSVRVLSDVNSLSTFTKEKNSDFGINQVVRVLDQIGNDVASLFNTTYIGKVQNDADGRVSFWNDVVSYLKELESLRAIENFSGEDITVEKGTDKRSVILNGSVTPVCAMEKIYMTVIVN